MLNQESETKKKYDNYYKKKRIFPKIRNQLIQFIKTDNIGEYSISIPEDAKTITTIIKTIIKNTDLSKKNNITITDGTSGIGGNVISFCKNFSFVNAIEIDNNRFDFLKNNVNLYNHENIQFINGDFVDHIHDLIQDIIFIDPPWGGKDYKYKTNIRLKLGDLELNTICNKCLEGNNCKIFVMKLPINYDIEYLKNKIKYNKKFFKIRNKILLVCAWTENIITI